MGRLSASSRAESRCRCLRSIIRNLNAGSLLPSCDDSGLDGVLQFLLSLIPRYEVLTAWIGGHVGVAEFTHFDFAGLPMFKSHECFFMRSSASKMELAFSAGP